MVQKAIESVLNHHAFADTGTLGSKLKPLMESVAASSVTLLVVDSEERAGRHGEEPGAHIALYLARHGARVEVEQMLSQGPRVADIILSFATDHGVDPIVIGAYSHARSLYLIVSGLNPTL